MIPYNRIKEDNLSATIFRKKRLLPGSRKGRASKPVLNFLSSRGLGHNAYSYSSKRLKLLKIKGGGPADTEWVQYILARYQ